MWQLEGTTAQVDFNNVRLCILLDSGNRQVLVQSNEGDTLSLLWDMPQVAEQPLVEAYVRGDDLVCTLGPCDAFPFTTQLYWTLRKLTVEPQPIAAVSLLVSIRTDLLDTEPAIEISTGAFGSTAQEIVADQGPAFGIAISETLTLLDFAVPEDCEVQSMKNQPGEGVTTLRLLFGHFLEKGVIRSGRLHAALFDGEISSEVASAVCDEFAASELPLTT